MLHDFEFTVCCEGGMHVHTCTVDTLEVTCNLLAGYRHIMSCKKPSTLGRSLSAFSPVSNRRFSNGSDTSLSTTLIMFWDT